MEESTERDDEYIRGQAARSEFASINQVYHAARELIAQGKENTAVSFLEDALERCDYRLNLLEHDASLSGLSQKSDVESLRKVADDLLGRLTFAQITGEPEKLADILWEGAPEEPVGVESVPQTTAIQLYRPLSDQ